MILVEHKHRPTWTRMYPINVVKVLIVPTQKSVNRLRASLGLTRSSLLSISPTYFEFELKFYASAVE